MAPKILCLHGMAGCKERLQKSLQPLQDLLYEKYELVYINAPFEFPKEWLPEPLLNSGAPSFNRWFEKCQHLTNGETRMVYKGLPEVSVDLDLEPALKKVQEVWDDTFVGIYGFSNGSMVAGMVSSLLVPQPKFVLFNGAIPEGLEMFSKTLNCPSLNLMGYTDGNRHLISRGNGLFETVHYEGGHRTIYDQATFDRIVYWLELLGQDHSIPIQPLNYTLSMFCLNPDEPNVKGTVSISVGTKSELKSITLDKNKNIRASKASVTCLRTFDNLESVKDWETAQDTFRYTQNPTISQSDSRVDIIFPLTLPKDSNFIIYLEFDTNMNEIGGDLRFPCFKWTKSTFSVNIFHPTGTLIDFIESSKRTESITINDIDYLSQQYSILTPIAPGLLSFDLKV
ncbi:hypothetical protein HK103_001409 [Boothiomyces macroporosus]|uniref:Serine hydrolase domain-containing protein n=1 Tax=Boothiomyces macroporosus TaxID=261099 RepID=A0AAD5UE90_9FUNG|nr:hypothetical protein HK103_001409 [Boothiomyces macroporosus]